MGRGRNGMCTQRGKKGAMKRASLLQLEVGEKQGRAVQQFPTYNAKSTHLSSKPTIPSSHLLNCCSAPGQAVNKET